jgi:hypothetical protein
MQAKHRRWIECFLILAIALVSLGGFFYWGTYGYYGVGVLQQVVILESAKPIAKVYYDGWYGHVGKDERRRVEDTADYPTYFLEPARLDGDRFTARIKFTTGPGIFDGPDCNPDVVVLVEFADGSRACRVADVPKGKGKEAIVVRFP